MLLLCLIDYFCFYQIHGPYTGGQGWPAVEGSPVLAAFDPEIPAVFTPTVTGLGIPSVFTSEFGSVTTSSFESMSPLLLEEHWGIHGGTVYDTCTQE